MELETKIKITVAAAICLPHTDRDIHGHYRVVDMNSSRR